MSDPDGFLTRWSRRKRQAAAEPDAVEPQAAPPVPAGEDAAVADPARSADSGPTAEAAPAVDAASLPAIESIDAATDIRGFLAKGVSPVLARAALRQAWRSDPAIRDFVGLADYDWDFNAPDSMRGFGPLAPGDDVRRLVAQMLGNGPDAAESSSIAAAANEPATIMQPEGTEPADDRVTAKPAELGSQLPPPEEEIAQAPAPEIDIAVQNPSQEPLRPVRRGHGGALPE
jgi:hypothetical protein